MQADVSQAADVEALINTAVETYGRLDCAHNNAGIAGKAQSTVDCTQENWDRIIAINLTGVWLCMKAEIPRMLTQSKGAIVNTASDAGLIGVPRAGAYVASKHGVVGLTKTAALEYAKAGIRVNAVCPGPIDTPMLQSVGQRRPRVVEKMAAAQPVGPFGAARGNCGGGRLAVLGGGVFCHRASHAAWTVAIWRSEALLEVE